jgi:hypothetical protein
VVAVLVLAAAGLAAWVANHGTHHAAPAQAGPPHSSAPSAIAAVALKPVSATSFDPEGDTGNEDGPDAPLAIDGNPATAWHTSYYIGSPVFGNLPNKKGTGLLLDMGKEVRLTQVMVQFGTTCCTHAQVEMGNSHSALSSFSVVASSDHGVGSTTFNVTSNAVGRYVLIWLTYLPQNGTSNQYQAFIYNVSVRGSTASQSG